MSLVIKLTELYVMDEKYEKITLFTYYTFKSVKMIRRVWYKRKHKSMLKSKRVASREVGGERVMFVKK